MSESRLWEYFQEKQIAQARPFDRDFLWVPKEAFARVEPHFVAELNILQPGKSYRSRALLRHIHAIDQGDCVFVHQDTGNVARFLPLGLVHLFIDVVPYCAYAWYRGVSFSAIFVRPQGE